MEKRLKKIEGEEWRYIPDCNQQYMVSNYGRVRSFVLNKVDGKIIRPCKIRDFLAIKITNDKKVVNWYIHVLVATVFIARESEELTHVLHLDMNRRNNHVSNLKWVAKAEVFAQVRQRNKLSSKKRKPVNSKLSEKDVAHLKTMLNKGVQQSDLAKLFCISEMQVTRIKTGENWGHVEPAESV